MAVDLDSPEVRARILEERWTMAVMDGRPLRFEMDGSESIDPYMTKRYERITDSFLDIIGVVALDGIHPYEFPDGNVDSAEAVVHRIWGFARTEILAWASAERRRVRWQAWRDAEEKRAVAS